MRSVLTLTLGLTIAGSAYANVPMGGLAQDRLSEPSSVISGGHVAASAAGASVPRQSSAPMATAVIGVVGPGPGAGSGSAPAVVHVTEGGAPAPVGQATVDTPPGDVQAPAAGAGNVVTVNPGAVVEEGQSTETAPVLDEQTEAEVAEYQRLFGSDPGEVTGEPMEMESGSSLWFWPVLLLLIGGVWIWRKRGGALHSTKDDIQIVGRASLGREGSLAVVEVEDNEGRSRRLLVGYGGGAPRLVADLAETVALSPSPAGGEDGGRRADAWSQALDQAQEGMETRPSHDELIANVLADREQVRRNLGELPNEGSRAGVRRRAYRGTMA